MLPFPHLSLSYDKVRSCLSLILFLSISLTLLLSRSSQLAFHYPFVRRLFSCSHLTPAHTNITMQSSLKVLQSHFPLAFSRLKRTECNCIRCVTWKESSDRWLAVGEWNVSGSKPISFAQCRNNENDKSSALMMIAFDKLYIRKMNFKTYIRCARHSFFFSFSLFFFLMSSLSLTPFLVPFCGNSLVSAEQIHSIHKTGFARTILNERLYATNWLRLRSRRASRKKWKKCHLLNLCMANLLRGWFLIFYFPFPFSSEERQI